MPETPSTNGSRWPALTLILITSLGVPGTVIALFKKEILEYPWWSLTLALLWGGSSWPAPW